VSIHTCLHAHTSTHGQRHNLFWALTQLHEHIYIHTYNNNTHTHTPMRPFLGSCAGHFSLPLTARIYAYTLTHIHTHTNTHTNTHTQTHTHKHTHTNTHTYRCDLSRAHVQVFSHYQIHAKLCSMYVYACKYVCMCACVRMFYFKYYIHACKHTHTHTGMKSHSFCMC
jgi:hypothetical protein